jgi:P-type E1-E2 ATPase
LSEELHQSAEADRGDGATVIYLGIDSIAAGYVVLSDTLRPDAAFAVNEIHKIGIKTVLLTGDALAAAAHMAGSVGISDLRSNLLPEDKLNAIGSFEARGEAVCMIGDGINDAPALKASQVGIAMGGIGSDIAIDAADIVLVGDDIKEIPHLLRLAKQTTKTIHINIVASLLLNLAAIALAIPGLLNPVLGALVHNAGSVAVIIHSSMLLNWRKH